MVRRETLTAPPASIDHVRSALNGVSPGHIGVAAESAGVMSMSANSGGLAHDDGSCRIAGAEGRNEADLALGEAAAMLVKGYDRAG